MKEIVKHYTSDELRHIRRVCEERAIELLTTTNSTHAALGMIEIATACGEELYERSKRVHYVDTCVEDGIRYSMQVRVF